MSVFLIGCASNSTKRLADNYPVSIHQQVDFLVEPEIIGTAEAFSQLMSAGILSAEPSLEKQSLTESIKKFEQAVAAELLTDFEAGLGRHSGYRVSDRASAKGYFVIEVVSISLVQKNTFSDLYKPDLGIKLSLFDATGALLFSEAEGISSFNSATPEYTLEEFRSQPERLHQAFRLAVAALIDDLLLEI